MPQNRVKRLFSSKPIVTTGVAFAISAMVIGIRYLGALEKLELYAYDRYLQQQPIQDSSSTPVVLIRATEQDFNRYQHPFSDGLMAQILKNLLRFKPATIGVDIFRDQFLEGREDLKTVIENNPQIVLIEKRLGKLITAPGLLNNRDQSGFSDLIQDGSGIIRRGLLMLWDITDESRAYLSLSLRLALNYLQPYSITLTSDPHNKNNIRIANTTIPRFHSSDGGYNKADDGGYQFLMDYGYGQRNFPSFTVSEVLENLESLSSIAGKIVILGTTAISVKDQHETPFSQRAGNPMYGIEIHGQIVDQLVRAALRNDSPVRTIPESYEISLIFLFSLVGMVLGVLIRSIWLLIVTMIATAALFYYIPRQIFLGGYWIPVIALSLAWVCSYLSGITYVRFDERKEFHQIRMLFNIYVAKKVATELWNQRDLFLDGGRPKPVNLTATVILTDLKDFTGAVESMTPDKAMEWINDYISAMTGIIEEYGGIVEDYAGDGIKATFGTPVPRTNQREMDEDARNAVRCALAMGEKLSIINAHSFVQGLPMERMRIGICTGQVTAGSIGNSERMAYTTIGDTVNVAARLESFEKESFYQETAGSFRVLIDEQTLHRIGNDFCVDYVGHHHLRGRRKATDIFRVYTQKGNTDKMEKR